MERRRGERYKLALPLRLERGTGVTRNMSTAGIYFETEIPHSIGDIIGLSVDFPDTTLQCEGRVVRVETLDSKFGVAVELTSSVFL